jgi:hypothetical protein
VLRIRIGFNADPDPAFSLNAYPNPAFYLNADPGPDSGSQTDANPYGSESWSDFTVKKVGFLT